MKRLLDAFRDRPLPTGAFLMSLAVALFFALRLLASVLFWSPPELQPIKPWMTVGIVARMHDYAPRALNAEAGFPRPDPRASTMAEIARARGVPVEAVIAELEAALSRLDAKEGRP
ncbi:hypothetical protein [Roseisalinus antarcticus]|uniref:Uncharacterized protein n=1 Tax=Roseisalinus antarcticus TaxID=254357 RepID=A0A1Y5S9G4_9RHOB|nr:hypothetical protein [Roseisalinus antarcticus]SLN35425.1 hypothetical protein ROA7023_01288 [Roseisalinus antarcticus]